MKKILLIVGGIFLFLIVIGIIGSAMGGSSTNKGTEKVGTNSAANTATKAPQQATSEYKVGDQVKSGDYVFSVNEVKEDSGTAYIKPKTGNVFIVPNISIQNNGTAKTIVSTLLQMSIKDEEGTKYSPTITSVDAMGRVDGELLAGDKIKGDVGFEIPTTAKGLKFYYQPEWLTGSTIVVDLGR